MCCASGADDQVTATRCAKGGGDWMIVTRCAMGGGGTAPAGTQRFH
jgi:hypothetical protein